MWHGSVSARFAGARYRYGCPVVSGGIVALVVAAGQGNRAGGAVLKQYTALGGEAVLTTTLRRLLAEPRINAVRAVIADGDEGLYHQAVAPITQDEPRLLAPVSGGADRQASVHAGLASLAKLAPDIVLIHDGVRPFASLDLIGRVIDGTDAGRGAIPALPVFDTLKRLDNGHVGATVDRAELRRVQTPQGFPFAPILAAHETAARESVHGLTDDAAIASRVALALKFVPGEEDNMKITLPGDHERAERMLRPRPLLPHTGIGFDVHGFEAGSGVVLCGVSIPFDKALKGHSDADVALHALTDAIYGALAEGDIGSHFPPTDPKWRGEVSSVFLEHAIARVAARHGRIVHVDLTIICEAPKIAPHRETMVENLAALLGLGAEAVSIKATTTERLGFTGREEGIAVQAVATVLFPDTEDQRNG